MPLKNSFSVQQVNLRYLFIHIRKGYITDIAHCQHDNFQRSQ